ncbi:hypothetical protein [Micromonospora sp. NPDC004704]
MTSPSDEPIDDSFWRRPAEPSTSSPETPPADRSGTPQTTEADSNAPTSASDRPASDSNAPTTPADSNAPTWASERPAGDSITAGNSTPTTPADRITAGNSMPTTSADDSPPALGTDSNGGRPTAASALYSAPVGTPPPSPFAGGPAGAPPAVPPAPYFGSPQGGAFGPPQGVPGGSGPGGYPGPPQSAVPAPGWRPPVHVQPAPPRPLPPQNVPALEAQEASARTVTYGIGLIAGAILLVVMCLLCSRLLF